jgi:hypothetical protein
MTVTDPAATWQATALRDTLQLAVPLRIEELRHLDGQQLADIARTGAEVFAGKGDDLQFGGRHCREAFAALVRGLAATALCAWGGVTFAGLHWCATPGCPAVDDDHPQPWPWSPRAAAPPRAVVEVHVPDNVL